MASQLLKQCYTVSLNYLALANLVTLRSQAYIQLARFYKTITNAADMYQFVVISNNLSLPSVLSVVFGNFFRCHVRVESSAVYRAVTPRVKECIPLVRTCSVADKKYGSRVSSPWLIVRCTHHVCARHQSVTVNRPWCKWLAAPSF